MATETIPAELLPCPFCGSGVVSVEGTMSSSYGWCRQCKTSGPVIWHGGPTDDRKTLNRCEAEAIAAWNHRAVRPLDAEPLARVTAAVKAAWVAHGEVPFPLYDHEAEGIARAAIRAYAPASQGDDTAGRKG